MEIENLSSGGNEAPVEKIEVTFINNLGTGFAERLRIPAGSTVGQLVTSYMQSKGVSNVSNYKIQMGLPGNVSTPAFDDVVENGYTISVTAEQHKGA